MSEAARLDQGALGTYRRLIGYVGKHRGAFFIGTLGATLFAATNAYFGIFARDLVDGSILARDRRMLTLVPLTLIGLFLLRGIGDFTQTYFMGYVGRHVVKRLRSEIFGRVLYLPIAYFDRNTSGVLLSRLTYNTEQVAQATTDSITVAVRETLSIAFLLCVMVYLNLQLTIVAFVTAPLISWLITVINRYFRRYSQRIQNSMGDVTRIAKEALEAPRVIKVFNAQAFESAQFEVANERNRRSNMKLILTKGLSNPIVQLLASIAGALVLYFAIDRAIRHELTAGQFIGFIGALMSVMQPLRNLVNVAGPIQQGIAAGQSIFELLDEPLEPASGTLRADRVHGEVELDNVCFSYHTSRAVALNSINLKIAPGETLAIVGRSGSGKSTLVNLLPRFYDVTSGSLRVDGRDVREYDLANLREQIALVSQDIVLFNDTIRNNIVFGRDASPAAIERAAEAAHVLEFTRELPQGLDTIVGDRGVLLSGGQRQRISIARALLKDAPILILDEATSALDTESERIIQSALEKLMHNRTTFVIAHRLSTVENASRIIVMDSGQLVEMGTHQELIAQNGPYAALHHMQFAE